MLTGTAIGTDDLFPVIQTGGENRVYVDGKREAKYGRPCGSHLPTRYGLNLFKWFYFRDEIIFHFNPYNHVH